MNRSDLEDLIESTFETVKKINGSKGREYADDEEALANFYHRAGEFDVDPKIVAGIFLGKHVDAIKAFIKTGDVRSEPIEGRVHDVILYSILLLGLVEDERRNEQTVVELAGENQLQLDLETGQLSAAEMLADRGIISRGAVPIPREYIGDPEVVDEHQVHTLDEVRAAFLPIEHEARNVATETQVLPAIGADRDPQVVDYNVGTGYSGDEQRRRSA